MLIGSRKAFGILTSVRAAATALWAIYTLNVSVVSAQPEIKITEAIVPVSFGDGHVVEARLFRSITLDAEPDASSLKRKCDTFASLIKSGQLSPDAIMTLSGTPSILSIVVEPMLPEVDLIWKASLADFAEREGVTLRNFAAPFRPKLIRIGVTVEAQATSNPERLTANQLESELNRFLEINSVQLEQTGTISVPIKNSLTQCMINDRRISIGGFLEARSFDRLSTRALLRPQEARRVVSNASEKIRSDRRASSAVDPVSVSLVALRVGESLSLELRSDLDLELLLAADKVVQRIVTEFAPGTPSTVDIEDIASLFSVQTQAPVGLKISQQPVIITAH